MNDEFDRIERMLRELPVRRPRANHDSRLPWAARRRPLVLKLAFAGAAAAAAAAAVLVLAAWLGRGERAPDRQVVPGTSTPGPSVAAGQPDLKAYLRLQENWQRIYREDATTPEGLPVARFMRERLELKWWDDPNDGRKPLLVPVEEVALCLARASWTDPRDGRKLEVLVPMKDALASFQALGQLEWMSGGDDCQP